LSGASRLSSDVFASKSLKQPPLRACPHCVSLSIFRKQYTRRVVRAEDIGQATRDQFSNYRPPWGSRKQQVPFESQYTPARSAVALALIFYLPAW
jgi:hypothetical protein